MDQLALIFEMLSEIREDQKAMLIQTTKTNGRVTALEAQCSHYSKDIDTLKDTASSTKGAGKIIYIVLGAMGAVAMVVIEKLIIK